MKRLLLSLLFVSTFFLFQTPQADAAAKPKKSSGPSIAASGTYIKKNNSIRAYFGNLKGVKKVTYTLMYQANGVGQGVEGSFSPGKKTSWSKDLYLGTCSGRVCIAHRNIKNIQLEVITKFTNNKTSTRTIKIK